MTYTASGFNIDIVVCQQLSQHENDLGLKARHSKVGLIVFVKSINVQKKVNQNKRLLLQEYFPMTMQFPKT